jgi:hypothetical protein
MAGFSGRRAVFRRGFFILPFRRFGLLAGLALLSALLTSAVRAEAAVYLAEFRPTGKSPVQGSLALQVTGGVLAVEGKLAHVPSGRTYGLLVSERCGAYEDGRSFLIASGLAPGRSRLLAVERVLTFEFRLISALGDLENRMLTLIEQTHVITLTVSFPQPVRYAACAEIRQERP